MSRRSASYSKASLKRSIFGYVKKPFESLGQWFDASPPNGPGLDGISIGTGAIIGAGAVVTKDVPPYTVVVGNPGKIIKARHNDEIIRQLLESEWWNIDRIRLNALPMKSPELLMNEIENKKPSKAVYCVFELKRNSIRKLK